MQRFIYYTLLICLCASGCNNPVNYYQAEGKIYGTSYKISYEYSKDIHQALFREMKKVDNSLSMFNPNSYIAKLNKNLTDTLDVLFQRMYEKAVYVNRATNGAFDITVAPLVNAWGFGVGNGTEPSASEIDSILLFVGMDKLVVKDDRLKKENPNIKIDASSIAKGFGVDLAAEYLNRLGVKNYMVEIGGEIRVKGKNSKGFPWRIGIDRPDDHIATSGRQLQMILELSEGALATSGNYRNFYVRDGKKIAHTINPRTGYPVQTEILSASVYAENCMVADAFATAFMVMGLEKSQAVINENADLEGCFIYENEGNIEIWMSEELKKKVLSK